ncbi:GNAT family N-acetyltransferase [Pediococcus acidilactici]
MVNREDEVYLTEGAPEDAQAIVELIDQLETETDSIEFDPTIHRLELKLVQQNLALIQQSPTNFLLLAKLGKAPIGLLTIVETDAKKGQAELGVGVLKKYWHNGIGTLLVDEALYWAKNYSDLSTIWLDVLTDNEPAIHLYEKMGFTTKKAPIKDDRGRSLKRMARKLS